MATPTVLGFVCFQRRHTCKRHHEPHINDTAAASFRLLHYSPGPWPGLLTRTNTHANMQVGSKRAGKLAEGAGRESFLHIFQLGEGHLYPRRTIEGGEQLRKRSS
jgi:hypothetical protein